MKVIKRIDKYRITEIEDEHVDLESLKGDCYKPEPLDQDNPEYTIEELKVLENQFEIKVYEVGVFGYQLEVWNPEIDQGWQHMDSCYGFVGNYETEKHYIVDEFLQNIKGMK